MKRQDPNQILVGDVLDRLQELPAGSVQCCVPEYAALAEKRINAVGASQIGLAI